MGTFSWGGGGGIVFSSLGLQQKKVQQHKQHLWSTGHLYNFCFVLFLWYQISFRPFAIINLKPTEYIQRKQCCCTFFCFSTISLQQQQRVFFFWGVLFSLPQFLKTVPFFLKVRVYFTKQLGKTTSVFLSCKRVPQTHFLFFWYP